VRAGVTCEQHTKGLTICEALHVDVQAAAECVDWWRGGWAPGGAGSWLTKQARELALSVAVLAFELTLSVAVILALARNQAREHALTVAFLALADLTHHDRAVRYTNSTNF
jgi:hypothetical protein